MNDIAERLRAIVSSPEVNPPLAPLLAIAEEVEEMGHQIEVLSERWHAAQDLANATKVTAAKLWAENQMLLKTNSEQADALQLAKQRDADSDRLYKDCRAKDATIRAQANYIAQQDNLFEELEHQMRQGKTVAEFLADELEEDDVEDDEPTHCEECDNDITYDCSLCEPEVESTDIIEQPETD